VEADTDSKMVEIHSTLTSVTTCEDFSAFSQVKAYHCVTWPTTAINTNTGLGNVSSKLQRAIHSYSSACQEIPYYGT